MKRNMQFDFEFAVERWRATTPKPADWLCGPPHFHDFPPECRVQALQNHLAYVVASNNTPEALAYYKAREQNAAQAELKAARAKAHRDEEIADRAETIRQANAKASAYMRAYRASKKALRPVKVPFNRPDYMRTYMRRYRAGGNNN